MEQNLPPWLVKLKQDRAQMEMTNAPRMLTLPDHLPSLLSKPQIAVFLGLAKSSKESKEVLIQQLLTLLANDESAKARFFEEFVQELAVGPGEVEAHLACTETERKLWTSDGKLPILATRTFRKAGRDLQYPVHDRRVILMLTQAEIEQWRTQHQSLVRLRRKTGVKKALVSREANEQTRQNTRTALEEMMQDWEKHGNPQLVAAFRLAFWTQWASRWAKENQVKSLNAIKYRELYQTRRDIWYTRKDNALHVLAQTPYVHISFYKPEEPDRWKLWLCDEHMEMKRDFLYHDKWEFFADHSREIRQCPQCTVNIEKNYYSLYSLQITSALFPELSFSFHMPYPLGRTFLPRSNKLPRVEHTEQDGMFRFGRPLLDDEKIFYREKDVETHFAQAMSLAKEIYSLSDLAIDRKAKPFEDDEE